MTLTRFSIGPVRQPPVGLHKPFVHHVFDMVKHGFNYVAYTESVDPFPG